MYVFIYFERCKPSRVCCSLTIITVGTEVPVKLVVLALNLCFLILSFSLVRLCNLYHSRCPLKSCLMTCGNLLQLSVYITSGGSEMWFLQQ